MSGARENRDVMTQIAQAACEGVNGNRNAAPVFWKIPKADQRDFQNDLPGNKKGIMFEKSEGTDVDRTWKINNPGPFFSENAVFGC